MSGEHKSTTLRTTEQPSRRPFRAVDVLSGSIDQRPKSRPERTRKQISAQLEPAQLRMLGELHARLNATASERIEKSDLVGLGIELLAAALDDACREPAPAPGNGISAMSENRRESDTGDGSVFQDVDAVRTYLRTYVREPRR